MKGTEAPAFQYLINSFSFGWSWFNGKCQFRPGTKGGISARGARDGARITIKYRINSFSFGWFNDKCQVRGTEGDISGRGGKGWRQDNH